jgi:serine/threonine protein kinase
MMTSKMTDDGAHLSGAQANQLGRYRLIRRLAKGGMAEVFLARSEGAYGFQKLVAIKRILPKHHRNPQFFRMLIDEAKISVMLNHPNIAQVLEFGGSNRDYFLVLEYVPGQPLSALMERLRQSDQTLGILESCFLLVQVLEGLHAAHTQTDQNGVSANIIHRDVSPQNILITYEGHVKLIDFGIARAKDRIEKTEIGSIKGKLRYLAPEMIDPIRFGQNSDFDHRADLFASGVILYELISGQQLFDGKNEFDVYDAITDRAMPELSTEDGCDSKLMNMLKKALSRNPSDRFDTARAFADELRTYLYQREPGFTQDRIAQKMQVFFSDEHMGLTKLNRTDGEIGKMPRQLFLSNSVSEEQIDNEMFSSSEKTVEHRIGTQAKSNDQLKDAFPNVSPNAETQVVEPRHLGKSRSNTGNSLQNDGANSPAAPQKDSSSGFGAPKQRGRSLEMTAESTGGSMDGLLPSTGIDVSHEEAVGTQGVSWRRVFVAAIAFGLMLAILAGVAIELFSEPTHYPYVGNDKQTQNRGDSSIVDKDTSWVTLSLTATPENATAERIEGGAKILSLPAQIRVRAGTKAELVFQAKGYESLREIIRVSATDAEQTFHTDLRPLPVPLYVEVEPTDADILIDGRKFFPGSNVTPGKMIRIQVEKSGYRKHVEERVPPIGMPLRVSVKLVVKARGSRSATQTTSPTSGEHRARGNMAKKGTLFVTSAPYWGRVEIDGKRLKETTPVRIPLAPGRYRVRVTHPPKGMVSEKTIRIRSNKETRFPVRF